MSTNNYTDNSEIIKAFTTFSGDDFTVVSREGKEVLLDCCGSEVFEADEIALNPLTIAPLLFRQGAKWGMVYCYSGRVCLPPEYDAIKPDVNGFIFLTADGKEGFIAGRHRVEPQFDSIEIDADENLLVTFGGRNGYVDENDEFTTDKEQAYYNMEMFL